MVKQNAKKWLISCFALIILIILFISATVYIIDPFFQFRVKDNSYMLNPCFVTPGIIKNHNYDTIIIGSSMAQNFNMDVFRQELGVEPIHIGFGGIGLSDEISLLDVAYEAGKAQRYYICADMYMFTDDSDEKVIPYYLLHEDFLSRCRYFLNYEAWFRFMPVDVGFMILDKLNIGQSKKFSYSKSIDRLGDWSLDFEFGEKVVWENYRQDEYGVSDVDLDDIYNRMRLRIDKYFEQLQLDSGEHIFFFPPYSMLYWASQSDETIDALIYGKSYFIKRALEKDLTVYDFQSIDITEELENYKDITHYKPEVNDYMTKCFATGTNVVTIENYNEYIRRLLDKRSNFIVRNKALLKETQ